MTRVVKIGGRAQGDSRLESELALALADDPRLMLLHGGGDEVSTLQRRLGLEPRFINGRRATTPEDLAVVQMVLSGATNKRLVARLLTAGISAAGVSGEDGLLLLADAVARESLGEVGTPRSVDPTLLRVLLDAGYLPVISPIARDAATGQALNVNGDDAAAAIAAATGADELLLVADVPGVLHDGRPLERLDADAAHELVESGAASGGMIAKLEAARKALEQGVPVVRIGDLSAIADRARGTVLTLSPSPV